MGNGGDRAIALGGWVGLQGGSRSQTNAANSPHCEDKRP
jgi:hypothetical protein